MDDPQVQEFCSVTGCTDPAKAKFFIESQGGDLASAIDAFFENDGHMDEEMVPPPAAAPAPQAEAPTPSFAAPALAPAGGSGSGRAGGTGQRRSGAPGNVRGFSDFRDDDDDDPDKPQEWFTGGGKSGINVVDPKQSNEDRLKGILDGARAHGAQEGRQEDLEPAQGGMRAFQGKARTLGGEDEGEPAPASAAGGDAGALPPLNHTITFWQNGFTVNDGPLRRYDDPANMPFMQSVTKGQCPRELAPDNPSTPVNINLVRKETEYEPPPEPKYKAFSGSGRTLGGGSSSAGASSSSAAPAAAAPAAAPPSSAGSWSLDESAPMTSLQLRLRDGSRLVAKFNLTNTVGDIRAFIANAQPGAPTDYTLQLSGFPPKQLTDNSQKISEGLANSVIIQR